MDALKRAVIKLKAEREELRRELLRAPSERLGGALGSGALSTATGAAVSRSVAKGGARQMPGCGAVVRPTAWL